jgi:hypothetical protein
MQIKKGTCRVVVIFPSLHIAFKFSIIHFRDALRVFRHHLKSGGWKSVKQNWSWSVDVLGSLKRLLFKGLNESWGEFRFYRNTHNPLLQPTYISLFGFLNIQRVDDPCLMKETDVWCQLYELTDGHVKADSHSFENPENFCFCNGKFRMVDYGSSRAQKVIESHGAKIVELFDPTYSWEEKKKKLIAEQESMKN